MHTRIPGIPAGVHIRSTFITVTHRRYEVIRGTIAVGVDQKHYGTARVYLSPKAIPGEGAPALVE